MAALREESVVSKTLSDAYDETVETDISEAFLLIVYLLRRNSVSEKFSLRYLS